MAVLEECLQRTLAGHGSVVILSGEGGMGKTRLSEEFARHARNLRAHLFTGRCFEGEWEPPYAPWAEMLAAFARRTDEQRLLQLLGESAPVLSQAVPELRRRLPEQAPPLPLAPEPERLRLYDAIGQLFLKVAESAPLVLILDDLQWADSDSLKLVGYLARFIRRSPILLLVILREPESNVKNDLMLRDALALLESQTECRRIQLGGLSDREVGELVSAESGRSSSLPLAQGVSQETGGNPFYVIEIVRHMQDRVVPDDRLKWEGIGPGVRDLGIPEGIRLVVGHRLRRLTQDTQDMVIMASGFADGFGFPEIQALAPLPEEKLLDCLDEAIRSGLIRLDRGEGTNYHFAHAIIRHAIYDQLNPDRRRRLHRRIASALEGIDDGSRPEIAGEIAVQYHAAAPLLESKRGIPYALAAADMARARYAHLQSVGFLTIARDLALRSSAQERAGILCRLAVAHAEALEPELALQAAEEAIGLKEEAGEARPAQATFLATVARLLKDGGATARVWERLVDRGLAVVEGQRDLTWARLDLLRDRLEPVQVSDGVTLWRWLGDDPEAISIARALGDEDDYARTLDSTAWRTRSETEGVLALARRWTHPYAVMEALRVGAGDLFHLHGDYLAASKHYETLLEISQRHGAVFEQAQALTYLALIQVILGDFSRAQQTAMQANEATSRLGSSHSLRFIQGALAALLAYYVDGDWVPLGAGVGAFTADLELARSPRPQIAVSLTAVAIQALASSRSGNRMAALAYLDLLAATTSQLEPSTYAHNSDLTVAAEVAWRMNDSRYAGLFRDRLVDLLKVGFGPSQVGPVELAVARMSALLGRLEEAEQYFEEADRSAAAHRMRPCLAISKYDRALALARTAPFRHREIAPLLEAASAQFHQLHMGWWFAEAIALQAESSSMVSSPRPPSPGRSQGRGPEAGNLTPREREIAVLVAAGMSNAEIAHQLVVSVRTVESHVANIMSKLGYSSRSQIAVWAVRNRLPEGPAN